MKNNSIESNGDDLEINHRPQKTWKEALLLMSDLMQVQNSVKMNLRRRKDLFSTIFLYGLGTKHHVVIYSCIHDRIKI